MKRYCLTLDLKDEIRLIKEYEDWHQNIWPEIRTSILKSGIKDMEIYRLANRLFMIIEAEESFSFQKKEAMDRANPKVDEWEELMWKYQEPLPWAKPGEKWVLMKKIFKL